MAVIILISLTHIYLLIFLTYKILKTVSAVYITFCGFFDVIKGSIKFLGKQMSDFENIAARDSPRELQL